MGFGHKEQMGFPDACITLAAFQQLRCISPIKDVIPIGYRPLVVAEEALIFGRNVIYPHLKSLSQHSDLVWKRGRQCTVQLQLPLRKPEVFHCPWLW